MDFSLINFVIVVIALSSLLYHGLKFQDSYFPNFHFRLKYRDHFLNFLVFSN